MRVARLSLTDFRSYADAVVVPGPGFVILTGDNGAGKTNLLEALSLLAPGRGLRGATLSEMARNDGPGGFAVAARLSPSPSGEGYGVGQVHEPDSAFPNGPTTPTPIPSPEGEGSITIGTGTAPAAPERRQVRIDGAPAAANSLAEWISVLWLTPAMDRLFAEGAAARRRFLDRLVLALDPGHAAHATRYDAAMRARNKLLAEPGPRDEAWLTALETRMAEHGAALAQARSAAVAALAARLQAAPEGPFARAGLALDGDQEADLARRLAGSRARDASAGRTLAGPHRTDLVVTHLGKPVPSGVEAGQPASLCSTGEQKALLIGLVLAFAGLVAERSGRRPILLLDEIAAHLDPARRAALFERLAGDGGQVWMTGTERAPFAGIAAGATWLEVANGAVRNG